MGNYRLSDEAQDDLIDIHQYGVREWGERQADQYYWRFISHLEKIRDTPPLLYPPVEDIRAGYQRSVCGIHSIYFLMDQSTVQIMAILRSQDATRRFKD